MSVAYLKVSMKKGERNKKYSKDRGKSVLLRQLSQLKRFYLYTLQFLFLDSWTFYVTFQIKCQQTCFKHVGIRAKKD